MTACVELLGSGRGRSLYFCELAELDDWPSQLEEPDPYFVLFLALDATQVPEATIRAFADKIATQGVAYVSAWGPECSRVHDIFDYALYVDNEELRREAEEHDSIIMTSWHDDEDLDEALYFAAFDATPDDRYFERCDALLAVGVASPAWASQMRRRLGDSGALQEDVLAREPETKGKWPVHQPGCGTDGKWLPRNGWSSAIPVSVCVFDFIGTGLLGSEGCRAQGAASPRLKPVSKPLSRQTAVMDPHRSARANPPRGSRRCVREPDCRPTRTPALRPARLHPHRARLDRHCPDARLKVL